VAEPGTGRDPRARTVTSDTHHKGVIRLHNVSTTRVDSRGRKRTPGKQEAAGSFALSST
jgi:hypothetical protein